MSGVYKIENLMTDDCFRIYSNRGIECDIDDDYIGQTRETIVRLSPKLADLVKKNKINNIRKIFYKSITLLLLPVLFLVNIIISRVYPPLYFLMCEWLLK
jgi:thiosulfate reductase cytochrome b subunit